ncbi:MAG: leucine-rich repeat domain-containing protein [Eubacterium sp.]|nr:leucine-rich repeat domain-containing protein [Eubacterium sp.]
MESNKKMSLGRMGILFFLTFFLCLVLQRDDVRAVTIPEGSYTPTGSAITYTFTGASDDLNNGFVANVERYSSAAIVNGELRIPDTILYQRDGEREVNVRVAGILRGVFSGSTSLTKLVLPDTITYIGQEAFANCTNLSSIQTVSTDGQMSPSTGYLAADEIEYHAFYGCSSLTGITLGEKVKGTGGVKTIQNEAFMNCSNLRSVEIGPTVSWVEGGAFANCSSLDGLSGGVKIRDNPLFFVQNGILYYKESNRSNVLLLCPAGTQIGVFTQFAENVTQIRNEAFYGCRGLSSITIPNTVKSIGDKAFYDCIGLGNVTIPTSVTSIGADVFRNCSSGLCIICDGGSTAERYAITNNITRSVECTVKFYNTETRQTIEKKVMSGGTVDPPVGWERTGYVLRWTDDFNSSTVVTSNRTVSTVWKKLYTVTFRDRDLNKESVVTGVEEGTEAAAPNWTRKGYRLTWSTENYKRVNADLTVDAVWLVSLTDGTDTPASTAYKKGDLVTIGNIVYKISGYNDKRVRVMSLVDERVTNVVVPNTVSFGGRTYTVTCINANAFRGNKFIKKVTLGKYIRSIEHNAFYNCTKLTRVVINSKNLVNISNYAFKKTLTSLKVYVPTRGLISTYRSLLLDGGMSSKAKVAKKP